MTSHLSMAGLAASFMTAAVMSVAAPVPASAAQETYAFDPGHTEVLFAWNHVGLSRQHGEFQKVEGEVVLDTEDPTKSSVRVTIPVDSLHTGFDKLDDHLLSADFFDAETYPEITFKSTNVRMIGKDRARVTGDLTIKDTTRSVALDVQLVFMGDHPLGQYIDAYKGKAASFDAEANLLRSEFGVGQSAPLVSDEIQIMINTEMQKQ